MESGRGLQNGSCLVCFYGKIDYILNLHLQRGNGAAWWIRLSQRKRTDWKFVRWSLTRAAWCVQIVCRC